MPRRGGRELMVGTFASLALLILAIAVMAVGGESRLKRGVAFSVSLTTTDGLRIGSPVKMAGVQIGSVRDVRLPTDPSTSGIDVELSVGQDYAPRVREDSRAALRYLQVLSGEKYVEITPGSFSSAALPKGATIPAEEQRELLERGADIATNIDEITVSLKNILGPLERGEGLLGAALQDPEFGKEGLAHMKASLENIEELTHRLRRGEGFAGRILFDKEFADRVDDISASLRHLASVMDSVSRREGAVGALLDEGGAGQTAIEDLREAAASLKRTSARLESTDGLIGRLLNDPKYSDAVAEDIRELFHNLSEITGKIERGEGTLGKLVNDPALYDGVDEIIGGANDSKFSRWLLRHYRKKGVEMEEEAPPEQEPKKP